MDSVANEKLRFTFEACGAHASFNHLFKVYGRMPSHPRPPTYAEIVADGRGIAGSPRTVTDAIRKQMVDAGADYFVGQLVFGSMGFSNLVAWSIMSLTFSDGCSFVFAR